MSMIYQVQERNPSTGDWEDVYGLWSPDEEVALELASRYTREIEANFGQRLYIETPEGRKGRVGDTRVVRQEIWK